MVKILDEYPHVGVISDDIYEKILYDDFQFSTLATLAPKHKNKNINCEWCIKSLFNDWMENRVCRCFKRNY